MIIDNILDFSRIEAGRLDFHPMDFDLRQKLRETIKPLRQRAMDQKALALTLEVSPDVPYVIHSDPARLHQVLLHLIDNAIKFTHEGSISVRVQPWAIQPEGGALHFVVQDSGVGIPREKQQIIFEAFSQADSSPTRLYGGTGLGLTISSRLVTIMNGRIWVESEPGVGSSFHFTIRPEAAAASEAVVGAVAQETAIVKEIRSL